MVGGEPGAVLVQKPFSLTESKRLQAGLGSCTTSPDHYIDRFRHIGLAFGLTWKAVMTILGQILSDSELETVIKEACKFASGLLLSDTEFPSGEQPPLYRPYLGL